jgi:hypothetical protein
MNKILLILILTLSTLTAFGSECRIYYADLDFVTNTTTGVQYGRSLGPVWDEIQEMKANGVDIVKNKSEANYIISTTIKNTYFPVCFRGARQSNARYLNIKENAGNTIKNILYKRSKCVSPQTGDNIFFNKPFMETITELLKKVGCK